MYGHMPDVILPREDQGIHIKNSLFILSADLGQANDYTAISVLERITTGAGILGHRGEGEREYHLRHLERPPRGTEYPAVVERLIELFRSETLQGHEKATVIDLTGVGRPVYDMMVRLGFKDSLNAISITGGSETTTPKRGIYHVPKRDLVTNLQVMLQNGSMKIAAGLKEADALVEELANFQVKITASGHDVYGGRSGVHDDLVLSVAMAAWLGARRRFKSSWERL